MFGPVVWAPVETRLREHAVAERARLDAAKAAGEPLERPQVLLVDDMPMYGRDTDGTTRMRRDNRLLILTVAEVAWGPPDPFDTTSRPVPTAQLRLVRAFAKANTPAWRLVFDELGYAPDFIVSDAGTARGLLAVHYPIAVFVPSAGTRPCHPAGPARGPGGALPRQRRQTPDRIWTRTFARCAAAPQH